MPNIKEYQSQVGVGNAPQSRLVSAGDIGSTGRGYEVAANAINSIGDKLADIERKEQEFEAAKMVNKEQVDLAEWMQNKQLSAEAGAPGFTESVKTELDARRQQMLDNAPSDHMREALDANLSRLHTGMYQDAIGYEAEARSKKSMLELNDIFEKKKNIVRANPQYLEEMTIGVDEIVDTTPGLNADMKAKIRGQAMNSLYDSAFDAEVSRFETSPTVTSGQIQNYLAAAKSKDGAWANGASAQGYDSGVGRLERLLKNKMTEETGARRDDFRMEVDRLSSTGTMLPGKPYSHAWIDKTEPDPDKRASMHKQLAMAEYKSEAVKFVKDAPAPDIQKAILGLEQDRKTSPDYHVANAAYEAMIQSARERDRAYKASAPDYVMSVSTAAQNNFQMFSDARKNPNVPREQVAALADQYARTMSAEQKRLYPTVTPRILPKQDIAEFKIQMDAIKNDPKGASNAVNVLQDTMQSYGKHWPKVVHELNQAEALAPGQFVAATMFDSVEHRPLAEEFVKASAVPKADLKAKIKRVGETDPEPAVKREVLDEMKDFAKTMRGMTPGQAEALTNSYADGITSLMLYRESNSGNRPSRSEIRSVVNSVILDKYEMVDGYRIPKKYKDPSGNSVDLDTDLIEEGVDTLKTKLDKFEYATIPNYGLRPEDNKAQYIRGIKRTAGFLTKSDDSGIRVVDQDNNQIFVKKGDKSVPLEFSWDDLKLMNMDEVPPRRTHGLR